MSREKNFVHQLVGKIRVREKQNSVINVFYTCFYGFHYFSAKFFIKEWSQN